MTSQKSFKPGDLVECVDACDTYDLELGKIYTVLEIPEKGPCIILKEFKPCVYWNKNRFKLYEKPEELTKPTFKVDDVVEWCGARGIVTKFDFGEQLSVRAKFDDNSVWSFTRDGRACDWHKTPSLVFISRPKKMVTKTVEAWANVYADNSVVIHRTREQANEMHVKDRITCVKLTGEYEVEVDDE